MQHTELEKLTASIIYNYLALHFNEQLKHTTFYKGKLKEKMRQTMIQLQKEERNHFDKMEAEQSEITHQVSSNIIVYMDQLLMGTFTDVLLLQSMQMAYIKSPKAIEGIINKVLNDIV
jgi:hypothetical protein